MPHVYCNFTKLFSPLIVQMTMGISNAILELATLGFLGIGANHQHLNLAQCFQKHVVLCKRQTG